MLQQYLTPLSRNVLIASFVIYLAQLIPGGHVLRYLAWHPFGDGFAPWQPLTAFLLSGPDPSAALFGWISILFFLATVQGVLGNRRLGFAMLASWAPAVASTLVLSAVGLLPFSTYLGFEPLIVALVCLFGFYMSTAQIRLWFVLPVPALAFAYGSGLYALLWLIFAPCERTWMEVAAWLGAFAFQFFDQGGFRRMKVKQQRARVERRFAVHEGGKGKPTWDN